MRTKTLLITAALSLAGVATSMAQVYSVNAVGYINLTMKPGFNMVANQLSKTPNANSLDNVIQGVPAEAQVLKFQNNDYVQEIYDGANWVNPQTGDPGVLTANPGSGFFFFNPNSTDLTVTLVGEVPQGTLNLSLPPGFALVSSIVPQAIALTAANGFPQIEEAQFLPYDAATQNYGSVVLNDGTQWVNPLTGDPVPAPTPAVGQGFFFFNPKTTTETWSRTFSVN